VIVVVFLAGFTKETTPMAHEEFDLSELLDALRAGGDIDIIRRSVELVLQALIDTEATEHIGAAPHERTECRTNQRNGTRARLLLTKAGDVELLIPKLRKGSFFPTVLERRRRIDRALFQVVMEAYVHGVSTRKVDDLVKSLGLDSGISKSEVSRICKELDDDLEAFRTRTLGHVEFPYVFVDATFIKARVRGRVLSRAVVVAAGVTATGDREVLGVDIGDTENGAFWTAFLRSLRARGLAGVELMISDQHAGLKAAIESVMVGAAWQRSSVNIGDEQDGPARCFRRRERTLAARPSEVQRQTRPSGRWPITNRPVGVVPRAPG
jgi:putative transposase